MGFESETVPALYRLLTDGSECQMTPWGCSECTFARPSVDALGEKDINSCDPDEGHYDCLLVGQERVWGENPSCDLKDWQNRAALEILGLLERR